MAIGDLLDKEIEEIVQRMISKNTEQLTKDDISSIIKELIPEIDTLIEKKVSMHVIKHLRAIAIFVLNNLQQPVEQVNKLLPSELLKICTKENE